MNNNFPESYLFTEEDLNLYELPQIFAASAAWYESGMKDDIATFDLMVRDAPPNRNFLLFGGLDEIIGGLLDWKYTEDQVQTLLEAKAITANFAEYLRTFRFTGSLSALSEGSVFFPGSGPVVRITAPIIESNLFTMFFMNALTGNTAFLSKAIRCVIAARPKKCIGLAGIRATSFETAMKGSRAAYIAGLVGSDSIPAFSRKFGLPVVHALTNAYHAVIKSFPSEIDAMRTMSTLFEGMINLMVDTYDFEQGMKNAITVTNELKQKKKGLPNIIIDSGDLFERSATARKMLDTAGLSEVKITIASNLDEYKIKDYMTRGIAADNFLVTTEVINLTDSPKLETVYKLAEICSNGNVKQCAKFSPGKESYPGKKQVFRTIKNGKFVSDVIGLEDENLGEPQLIEIFRNGKLVYERKGLNEIREYTAEQVALLPEEFLQVDKTHEYKPSVSPALKDLLEKVKKEHM